jgi:ABC-type sugar transport system ATPase subunit
VSEDRKGVGLVLPLSVRDNITLSSLKRLFKSLILFGRSENKVADEIIEKLRIKTPSRHQSVYNLSGGNQQKVVIGKAVLEGAQIMIMDEPTRGIDIGAKREIEDLIRQMADEGISVLLISSEFEELIRNCDRVEVIRDGANVKTLTGDAISERNIIAAIAGAGIGGSEA